MADTPTAWTTTLAPTGHPQCQKGFSPIRLVWLAGMAPLSLAGLETNLSADPAVSTPALRQTGCVIDPLPLVSLAGLFVAPRSFLKAFLTPFRRSPTP